MQLFFVYLINLIKKILIFLIGPVSRAARWQLKASRPPGLQVESYLLQQDLAAGAKIKSWQLSPSHVNKTHEGC